MYVEEISNKSVEDRHTIIYCNLFYIYTRIRKVYLLLTDVYLYNEVIIKYK